MKTQEGDPNAPEASELSRKAARLSKWLCQPWFLSVWCVLAAFGTYASMYGFRKPFTAGAYLDPATGISLKSWLVTTQVLGYMLSKFIGIRVIAEMRPERRAGMLLALIGIAEISLLLFAVTPAPYNIAWLFFNGLPLGMVFGLVLGFLEGRRQTEAFVAGLCASFILADGVTKSVGAELLRLGVAEGWMPFVAGLVFLLPLVGFVWMLSRIPAPNALDIQARSARSPMTRGERVAFIKRHGLGLAAITLAYLLVTVLRSLRADFAPEIWAALGSTMNPGVFTRSELMVALGVVVTNGLVVLIRDNRRAFFTALTLSIGGLTLAALAVIALRLGQVSGFQFMVLLGLGMYVPYVAVHTTVFERLIALTRDRGNIGYLMYLADAFGYLGYVAVMLGKQIWPVKAGFLDFFTTLTLWAAGASILSIGSAMVFFRRVRSFSPRLPDSSA